MVHAGTTPGKKPTDRRIGAESREELDSARPEAQVASLDTLAWNRSSELDLGSEETPVGLHGLVEILDGHRDVVKRANLHGTILTT
jgi:hypothetical protein